MAASEETGRKQARKWKDEEVNTLIDLLEQQTCLWDCCAKEYHLKDKRDMAYEALNKQLNIPISDIKYKIAGLRSQLIREVTKTNQKKSGQGVEENYKSTWIYWEKLQFLLPVIRAGKSRDNLQTSIEGQDAIPVEDDDEENDKENQVTDQKPAPTKPSKRKAEKELMTKKQEVLDRCLNVLKEPLPSPQVKKQCHFSLYVAEKLANFDKRTRIIAEKRISDILFELELGGHSQTPGFTQYSPNECSSGSSYMGMLQSSQTPQYHSF